jgi:hypothetical protein
LEHAHRTKQIIRQIGRGRTKAFVAGKMKEEPIVLALKAMTFLKADEAPKVELLSHEDQCQTYKVCIDGHPLLVRSLDRGRCAAAHFYATSAAHHVPDFRPKALACDVEHGILVEEWLDPGEYKSLAQELLQEPASSGWSTPFRTDEFSQINFESLLYEVGEKIGKIHTGTRGFVQSGTDEVPTRAKPSEIYWRAARVHPQMANRLRGIAEKSARVEPVLLHGCLSPGAVLFGEEHVAIVSSGQAAWGDPALDLAHMMAHLFIASVHRGSSILVTSAGAFHSGYATTIEALDKRSIMHRAGPLSVAFMLALLEDEQISALLTLKDQETILTFSQWWLGRRDYTLGQVRYALWDAVDLGAVDWRTNFESLPRADD